MLDQNGPLNSLGFAKDPADTRVVVAMSGGVDSSVVAAELLVMLANPMAKRIIRFLAFMVINIFW